MTDRHHGRRRFLRHSAQLAAGALPLLSSRTHAALPGARGLALLHTHTREQLDLVDAVDAQYLPAALGTLNRFLRDHYSGDVGIIDPAVFDLLHRVRQLLGSAAAFEVISGYRCPATNAQLRATRAGGVGFYPREQFVHLDTGRVRGW